MGLSTRNDSSNNKSPFQFLTARPFQAARVALITAALFGLMISPSRQGAQQQPACEPACERINREGCFSSNNIDLLFLVDRSGSLAFRGQTYNAEIEGIVRALADPDVIPRDGSISVGVITFSAGAEINIPLTEINSASDAAAIAAAVQRLKCGNIGSAASPCPADATDYGEAIRVADRHFRQVRPTDDPRFKARRIMLMSSDGGADLRDSGLSQSTASRIAATREGIRLELDTMMIGVEPSAPEFAGNSANLARIIFRTPESDGSPLALVINGGDCNRPGSTFGTDCSRQSSEFAANTRTILRRDVAAVNLVVTTDADTDPNAPATGNTLSLRQAIERANCNGGNATITFAESVRGKVIRPLVPLPAITQPDVTINGCVGTGCGTSVTIDGTGTDTAKGERHCDGILIRSSRAIVRGLRIINFKRAGVALSPCSFDSFGQGRVESNTLEDNEVAGVLVCDPPPIEGAGSLGFETHNEGNVISRNTISGSATLIDLGCDEDESGPGDNDAGDTDEGPNTLLNFPDQMSVVSEGSTVKVSGQANGPTVAGATIEIFAVTRFSVGESGRVFVEGVSFLSQTTADANGAFMATGVAPSATGIYTATVTDARGNTSELMADGDPDDHGDPEIPRPRATVSVSTIAFGNVDLNAQPQVRTIVITNTGTAPLTLNCRDLVASCTATPPGAADSRFSITGCPTGPINPGTGPDDQSNRVTITVTFRPNPSGFAANPCGATGVCFPFNTNDPQQLSISAPVTATVIGGAKAAVSSTQLTFRRVTAQLTPRTKKRKIASATFTVENTGCDNLVVSFGSIQRVGNDVSDNQRDDSRFFSVEVSNPAGGTTAFGPTSQVSIARGSNNRRTFTVYFNPVVPAVANCKSQGSLAASSVLPDELTSVLTLNTNEGSNGRITVTLSASVNSDLRLIDPVNPASAPVVKLSRSGDEFTVEFSVYDPDLNASTATIEFLRSDGRVVDQPFTINLRDVLPGCLAKGQSFTVTHRFTGANDNSRVTQARVTVSDGASSDTATSGAIGAASARASGVKR